MRSNLHHERHWPFTWIAVILLPCKKSRQHFADYLCEFLVKCPQIGQSRLPAVCISPPEWGGKGDGTAHSTCPVKLPFVLRSPRTNAKERVEQVRPLVGRRPLASLLILRSPQLVRPACRFRRVPARGGQVALLGDLFGQGLNLRIAVAAPGPRHDPTRPDRPSSPASTGQPGERPSADPPPATSAIVPHPRSITAALPGQAACGLPRPD